MAIMIPDSCPTKASQGEKRLYKLFQDLLPDNFSAWYEPVVQGRYPDFTLLADTFGLLVLEVKGWYPKQTPKRRIRTSSYPWPRTAGRTSSGTRTRSAKSANTPSR